MVITGSTRGFGLALAKQFLESGETVIISARNEKQVKNTIEYFNHKFPGKIDGIASDVTSYEALKNLGNYVVEKYNQIDLWINNAGTNGYQNKSLDEYPFEILKNIIETNLLGTIYGCKVAINIMKKQGFGKIVNIDGRGANGAATPFNVAYGASKRGIPQLMKSLNKELKDTNVVVHTISPGMVLTDLLIKDANKETKKIFNILAETPDTAAAWVAKKIYGFKGRGHYPKYLTNKKASLRFLTAFNKRNKFFDDDGNLLVDLFKIDSIQN